MYDEVNRQLGLDAAQKTAPTGKEELSLGKRIIRFMMSGIAPAFSMLCASGVIKGLISILVMTGVITSDSGMFTFLSAIGDAFFYFMPIIIGYNVTTYLGGSGMLGMVIGAVLCYPTINGVDLNLFGMNINVTYTGTFLPMLLISLIEAPWEKFLNKVIPSAVKNFMVPIIVLLTVVPLGFIVINPVANVIAAAINTVISGLFSLSAPIAGLILGGMHQILVIFGLHQVISMTSFINLMSGNADPVLGILATISFTQVAALLAIMIKTKNKSFRNDIVPALFSAIFGVTEPAIYGITLQRVKVFASACIGGAVMGLIMGIAGLKLYSFAGLGIVGLLGFIDPMQKNLIMLPVALLAGMAVTFILTLIVYKDEDVPASDNGVQ